MSANRLVLSFKKGIAICEESSDRVMLRSQSLQLNFGQLSRGLLTVFGILNAEGATEEELSDLVLEIDGGSTLSQFYYYLEQFTALGLICHSLKTEAFSLLTLVPMTNAFKLALPEISLETKYVLSRFAYCYQNDREMVLETPLFPAKLILNNWRSAAMVAELARSQDCYTLTDIPGVSTDVAQMFLRLLLSVKVIAEVAAIESDVLAQWEFHDLLFHSRSRVGRSDRAFGKTYRFLDKIEPLPAIKAKMSPDAIALYKPDLSALIANDAPFTQILEQRKSIRIHGNEPITVRQLGEFLYRCGRVREIVPRERRECSDRPYPSGGACYEIEFYISVNICAGLAAGLYHYCPQHHQLEKICDRNSYLETHLNNARNATGEESLPQILIVLTARFARVSWEYEAIAYSLILKHVGVLFQTMYLVATAMDLAPCALGTGNSDLFAKALGIDYYAESSVGEFILGAK